MTHQCWIVPGTQSIRSDWSLKKEKTIINCLTSLLSLTRWSTKNRASKGEECKRMISKRSNVSFFHITYQHRVRCIEATKLLPPADRPSLSTLISKFYIRIIFIFNLLKLYYLFISRLNGHVVLLYSAINLKSLVRAKNQSPYSVTRCCYCYINKLPYFVLRKTNLCSYHGTRSRWISVFKFGTFTTLTKCIRSLLYSSRKWWGNSWFRLWKQQFGQLWWPLWHARLGFWFPGNTHFPKNESREVLWRNVAMQVSHRW